MNQTKKDAMIDLQKNFFIATKTILSDIQASSAINNDGSIKNTIIGTYLVYEDNGIQIRKIEDMKQERKQQEESNNKTVQSIDFNANAFQNNQSVDTWFTVKEAPKPAATQEEEDKAEKELKNVFEDMFKSDKKFIKNVNGVDMNYKQIGDRYIQLMKEGVDNSELRKLMDIVNDLFLGDFDQYESQLKSFKEIIFNKCN
jgi:hypothetical protein